MTGMQLTKGQMVVAVAAVALIAAAAGFGLARLTPTPSAAPADGRKVLYWYDPMVPAQHFDKPGKSPFMDMQLVPRYADEAAGPPGVQVDPRAAQSLGVRTVLARTGQIGSELIATGVIEFNQRHVAILQSRAGGFVQRVYGRAPGDRVGAGAPIVDLYVPDWRGAQSEFLALRRTGDERLIAAGRRRLELLGMAPALVQRIERTGQAVATTTISTPIAGVIQKLDVRAGMTVSAGQTLAEVNGLSTVWLTAAVPQAQAATPRVGEPAQAEVAGYPGETFSGRVSAIVPDVTPESRTLQVRIELPNTGGRLSPGQFATVRFGGDSRAAVLVPSEAVIRTGRRDLVMLALADGRFQPAEVRVGRQAGGQTEILAGLRDGERVVASGQFLLDSEASLSGIQARPISSAAGAPAPAAREGPAR